jgi:signal transduction histidine kinase
MNEKQIAILLIEDNPGDARLIREILEEETLARFTLRHAARLEAGLAVLDEGNVDVVLLDLGLPDSQGLATFRATQGRSPRVPIVVLTSLDDEGVAIETLQAGGQDYLIKTYLNYAILHRSILHAIERKRAEDELHRAREAAEAANRAKDEFLAVLSHELRTPLTPVLLTVSAVLEDPTTATGLLPALSLIRGHVELEARLIDDLLDLTLVSRGEMRISKETFDAHDSIRQALDLCRVEVDAGRFHLLVDLSATDHHVDADPVRFQQVLRNLLKNAIQYTPTGGTIAVRSRNQAGSCPGRPLLIIEVSDSGVGIDPEDLPTIFRAFDRGKAAHSRRYGSLALGLTISRALVEAQGGRLAASSAGKGRGATFTLDLATVPATVAARAGTGGAKLQPPLKILLVEDNEPILRTLAWILTRNRHEVRAVADLSSARKAVAEEDFDLVISDIELVDGTGLELMRELSSHCSVPGIALSGFGSDDDIRLSREAGFAVHLTKPIDVRTLEATIARVVAEAMDRSPRT